MLVSRSSDAWGERADDYIRLKQAGAFVVVKRQYASEQKGRWSEANTLEPRATPLVKFRARPTSAFEPQKTSRADLPKQICPSLPRSIGLLGIEQRVAALKRGSLD